MLRLAVALLLATAAVASASEVKVPAFLWGSTDFFQPAADGDSRRASYQGESMETVQSVVGALLCGSQVAALPAGSQDFFKATPQTPHVTVLFHGRGVDSKNVGDLSALHTALEAAPASLSLPFVTRGNLALQRQLLKHAAAVGAAEVHHLGDCGAASAAPRPLGDFPLLSKERRAVVVVCPAASDSLPAQMEALAAVSSAAAQLGLPHLVVFTADPPEGRAAGGGRSLLARGREDDVDQQSAELKAKDTPAPDPTKLLCDERCRTQVNQLEAAILLLTLLVALGLGTYCMGILDGPTRFESQKDD
mmetsp:Transcript_3149/g.9101  ORF Transcript_3149/g.9101 Transcript_3149/m.9101 type:complete len:306 (+) Transcript_3149:193-1110(+)|eukprot:CAMPEP_0206143244 /NCGR_PEP_ID=MMETSP1473-20131121/19808_1 /ASSEMBLY_ACC=CAM_ASM_001109 /TAXON_ID=1461547 /ORGANISM="Stichococcus sp, Strain RCC1054" /LENGTH=305 /DNA_ID=CAMNT_0053538565 /DNA_START=126 /DNA_END=1043 /DNA_ORIENTATION=-